MATFRQLPSKKWQVIIRRQGYPAISKTFLTKGAATSWAKETESRLELELFASFKESRQTSMHDLIERYRLEVTPNKRGCKQESYRLDGLDRHLGHYGINAVTAKVVCKFRDDRIKAGIGVSTIKHDVQLLSLLFDAARIDWGIHCKNPTKDVRLPQMPAGRTRRLMEGELTALLAASVRVKELPAIIEFAVETASLAVGGINNFLPALVAFRETFPHTKVLLIGDAGTEKFLKEVVRIACEPCEIGRYVAYTTFPGAKNYDAADMLVDEGRETVQAWIQDKVDNFATLNIPAGKDKKIVTAEEVLAEENQTGYLVRGLIYLASMSLVFGASGTYKSFLVLDLVLHLVLGIPWCGRETTQSRVLYVAAEGYGGFKKRLAALLIHLGLAEMPEGLYVLPLSAQLIQSVMATSLLLSALLTS